MLFFGQLRRIRQEYFQQVQTEQTTSQVQTESGAICRAVADHQQEEVQPARATQLRLDA